MKSARLAWLVVAALLPITPTLAAPPVTFASLMTEISERSSVARPAAYTCKQFSSYDRASTSRDHPQTWFANGDAGHYLRTERHASHGGREEWVMAEMLGPGAVVRVWSPNPKGTLRVYLDGKPDPVIEAPMAELMSGKGSLGGVAVGEPWAWSKSQGWNFYLPIPYASSCKITQSEGGSYYQINYRTYPAGTSVQTFVPGPGLAGPIAEAAAAMRNPGPSRHGLVNVHVEAQAGETTEFWTSTVAGEVTHLVLTGSWSPAELRGLVLIAEFDGELCVWCPLGDFFGVGAEQRELRDLYRAVTPAGSMASAWTMPFAKSASLRVLNLLDRPVKLSGIVGVASEPAPWTERSMHFHAGWRAEGPISTKAGAGTKDYRYLHVRGTGVYAGDNLSIVNPVKTWWGEGDEKIFIDGEDFPSHFGTGTEDYYGYGWCNPTPFQSMFVSQVRCDGVKHNWGHTAVTRVRALDAIPFTTSIAVDMEVWHWVACDVWYASTAYWYARPGAWADLLQPEHITTMEAVLRAGIPEPPPLPPPFKFESALECESLKVQAKSDGLTVVPQDMEGFGARTWSGESHLWVQGRRAGDFVELAIPAEGPRRVTLHATKSWDYGVVKFSLNGSPSAGQAGTGLDLWCGERRAVVATGPIDLGMATPKAGVITLRAEVVGGNDKAEGSRSFFGLDAVVLTPAE